ncbi:hypothetical protein [Streptomyces sp. NBC_00582]|uniref:hypothetical protein n=1 Tax=Streptomyces sp. NBC_00582 TaxID=2975783 RepID=UPI002E8173E1|nr:hypothetical protein [Streptomyces sp. NBC_00582]WUB68379.1 hypothetical protein OG852_49605 [Streptomyces sp. NBC_00582]
MPPRRSPVRRNGTISQRTVSEWSGVSAGTLKNLARIDLIPEANALRPHDVVLAQVAAGLGATRSTNRDDNQDPRTTEALRRDWDAVRKVAQLLLNAEVVPVDPRTRLVALADEVEIITKDYELLRYCEDAVEAGVAIRVLPVGTWYQNLQKRLGETVTDMHDDEEPTVIAA